MFENTRRDRQARNFTTHVPKILDLKSSSEKIFSEKLTLDALDYMSIYNRFCKVLYVNVNKCCDISMTRERRIYDLGTKSKWDGNVENRSSREVLSSGAFPLWIESVRRHNFHNTLSLFLSQTRNFYRSHIICQFIRE